MKRGIAAGLIGLGLWVASIPVAAHMPYLLPSTFDAGTRDRMTVEASFGEDAFRPEVAMRDAPFEVTGPDGRTVKLPAPVPAGDRTMVEAALPGDGLYRISSGQRLGRMNKMYRRGADWVMVGEGDTPPAGATLVDARSTTLADVYVIRGKPGATGALKPRGTALEIVPRTDPSALAPRAPAGFTVLFDGRPLTGATVTVFREAGFYDGRKQVAEAKTDRNGGLSATLPDAGRYLVMVRYGPDRPPANGGPYLSYTATLALEAI